MLSEKEYKELKAKELVWAEEIVKTIQEDPTPTVKYKDSRPITDIKDMFVSSVELYGDNVAFYEKLEKGGEYTPITYKEAYADVAGFATGLLALGLHNQRIGIIGENSYKWAVSYLASTCGVGITVPLDKELSDKELLALIKRAEIKCLIFTEKYKDLFEKALADEDNNLSILINMDGKTDQETVKAWDVVKEEGMAYREKGNQDFENTQIKNDEMSVLLFTSGTTGASKGVMLSQSNIAADLMVAPTVLTVHTWDIFFSVLPLHHTYECTCGFLMPLYKGASIAYCEGLKYITKNLAEVKPTMFLGVPVLFETLHKKIWQNVRKKGKEDLLKKVIKVNVHTKKVGLDLGNIFFKEIRQVFGGRMRMMICGGAAINPEVLQGIRDFGITAVQGYGLTECAPMGALNPDTAPKNSAIGKKFPGTDIKIANAGDDGVGEICLAGPNIMMGYYENPEETAKVIKDGWFHTGDLGYIDEDGYAYITGRAKNVIITKNGKNVYPEELEYYINNSKLVLESMVFGEDSKVGNDTVIVAAIRLDDDEIKENHSDKSEEELEKLLWEEIDKINDEQPIFKKIRKIVVKHEDFEKSTTKKIKRFVESNKNS